MTWIKLDLATNAERLKEKFPQDVPHGRGSRRGLEAIGASSPSLAWVNIDTGALALVEWVGDLHFGNVFARLWIPATEQLVGFALEVEQRIYSDKDGQALADVLNNAAHAVRRAGVALP